MLLEHCAVNKSFRAEWNLGCKRCIKLISLKSEGGRTYPGCVPLWAWVGSSLLAGCLQCDGQSTKENWGRQIQEVYRHCPRADRADAQQQKYTSLAGPEQCSPTGTHGLLMGAKHKVTLTTHFVHTMERRTTVTGHCRFHLVLGRFSVFILVTPLCCNYCPATDKVKRKLQSLYLLRETFPIHLYLCTCQLQVHYILQTRCNANLSCEGHPPQGSFLFLGPVACQDGTPKSWRERF